MEMKRMIDRLSQLRYLKREIDELSQRVAELELRAQGGVGRVTGLPGGGRRDDRMADYALKALEVRDHMDRRRADCMEELGRLYAFIDDVPDSLGRQVLAARYIDGLSWQQVAWRIGETDEQVPRRLHNKILQEKSKFDENDESTML